MWVLSIKVVLWNAWGPQTWEHGIWEFDPKSALEDQVTRDLVDTIHAAFWLPLAQHHS